jgi:hypothetical protein
MIAAFEIARLFRHDLTICARVSQVALAMENIAAWNVTPSAFAVMRLPSSDLHFFTRKRNQGLLPCRVGRGWIKRVVWDMRTGATDP